MKDEPKICDCGDHTWLPLNDGFVVLVSPQHGPLLTMWRWYATKDHGTYYARRAKSRPTINGQCVLSITMHRVFCPCNGSFVVDHENGNGLDNRESNLNPLPEALNKQKQRKKSGATSRYRGVSFYKNKWRVTLQKDRKQIFLGYYRSEEAAARAYDQRVIEVHGPGAILNFPYDLKVSA